MYILLLIDSHLHKMISFGYHNGELFPILVSQISLSLSLPSHSYIGVLAPISKLEVSFILCVHEFVRLCVDMFVPWGMKTVVEQCHQF